MHKTDTPVRFGNVGGSVLGTSGVRFGNVGGSVLGTITGFASDVIKQISDEAVRYSQEHNNTQ